MSKQDRQGVRTAVDLERKYNFGQTFAQQGTQVSRLEQEISQFESQTNDAIMKCMNSVSEHEERIDALELSVGTGIVSIEITEVRKE